MKNFYKYSLILLNILLFVSIRGYAEENYAVNEKQLLPSLHYDSEPFAVNKYSTSEIMERARNLGYWVRVGSASGPPYKIYNGTSPDVIVDNYGNFSFGSLEKVLGINTEGSISLQVSRKDYQFGASPVAPDKDPYTWWVKFISKRKGINESHVNNIILSELESLGIASKNTTIRFREGYAPPEPFSEQAKSNGTTFSKLLPILVLIVLFLVSIVLFIKMKGGKVK